MHKIWPEQCICFHANRPSSVRPNITHFDFSRLFIITHNGLDLPWTECKTCNVNCNCYKYLTNEIILCIAVSWVSSNMLITSIFVLCISPPPLFSISLPFSLFHFLSIFPTTLSPISRVTFIHTPFSSFPCIYILSENLFPNMTPANNLCL